VETEGADWFYQSSEAGQLVTLPTITSIAKTLGAKSSTPEVYQILSRNVERALRVSDKEAVEALVAFLDREKLLVEPAAACVVAAVLKNPDLFAGSRPCSSYAAATPPSTKSACGDNSSTSRRTQHPNQCPIQLCSCPGQHVRFCSDSQQDPQ
jgi:threonine dehydratase